MNVYNSLLIIPLHFGHWFPLCLSLPLYSPSFSHPLTVKEMLFKEGKRTEKRGGLRQIKVRNIPLVLGAYGTVSSTRFNLGQIEAMLQTKQECLTSLSLNWRCCFIFTKEKENWVRVANIPSSHKHYCYFILRQFTYWQGKKEDMPLHIECKEEKLKYLPS